MHFNPCCGFIRRLKTEPSKLDGGVLAVGFDLVDLELQMFHQYRNLVKFLVICNDVVGPELDVQSGVVVLVVKNSEKASVQSML